MDQSLPKAPEDWRSPRRKRETKIHCPKPLSKEMGGYKYAALMASALFQMLSGSAHDHLRFCLMNKSGLISSIMPTPPETLLLGFETHSVEKIKQALAAGADANALIGGKTPLTRLMEMYSRSSAFSDCVRCLVQAGARCPDSGLLAVLLDDAAMLEAELRKNSSLLHQRIDVRCAFTPLTGASLLHVAAEFGLLNAAATLIGAGADLEAKAAVDGFGFNGHTPIFHTVCQNRNHGLPVMQLFLKHGAKVDVRLPGITWGKGFEWETTLFDVTPLSYAQAGLLPQFQRDQQDVYHNIRLLAQASGRVLPEDLNVPNKYLRS
jgi:hypothetical protein